MAGLLQSGSGGEVDVVKRAGYGLTILAPFQLGVVNRVRFVLRHGGWSLESELPHHLRTPLVEALVTAVEFIFLVQGEAHKLAAVRRETF